LSDEDEAEWGLHSGGLPDTTASPLADHLVEVIGAVGKLEALMVDADRGEERGCARKLAHLKARVAALAFPEPRAEMGFRR
jgi:hypothetical protein